MSPFLTRLLEASHKPNLHNQAMRWELLFMRTGKPQYRERALSLYRRIEESEAK